MEEEKIVLACLKKEDTVRVTALKESKLSQVVTWQNNDVNVIAKKWKKKREYSPV